jgi:hypothetical protein
MPVACQQSGLDSVPSIIRWCVPCAEADRRDLVAVVELEGEPVSKGVWGPSVLAAKKNLEKGPPSSEARGGSGAKVEHTEGNDEYLLIPLS